MLKRNIAANLVGQIWVAAVAVVFVPVYIRLLGIEAYGLIGFFATLQVWLTLLDSGLTPMIARETARLRAGDLDPTAYRDLLRSVETVLAGVGLLLMAGLWLAARWISTHWLNLGEISVEEATLAVAVMGTVIGLRVVEACYRSALMGGSWQISYNVYMVIAATLRNVVVIGVLLLQPTPSAFFLWQAAISVIGVVSLRIMLLRRLPAPERPARASLAALSGVARFAGGMLGITILSLALSQGDKIVLTSRLSLADFGYYAFAWSVAVVLLTPVLAIMTASYPALVAAWLGGDKARLRTLARANARLIGLIVFPLAITFALWSQEAIFAWSNDPHLVANSAALVTALSLGFALNGMFQLLYYLQLASGRTGLIQIVYAVTLIAYIPALLAGTASYGALAAAWLWLAVNVALLAAAAPSVFKRLLDGGFVQWLLRDNLPIALAALAVPLAVRLLTPSPEGRIESFATVAAVGLGSFLCASLCVPEAHRVVRAMLARARSILGTGR